MIKRSIFIKLMQILEKRHSKNSLSSLMQVQSFFSIKYLKIRLSHHHNEQIYWIQQPQQSRALRFTNFTMRDLFQLQNIKESKSMKNTELFETISQLVQMKKRREVPEKPSFAHNYCKEQIQKKKLIPFNPNSKMNRIMKNFYQLQTYVNVQKLFECINELVNEKKKEESKSQKNIKWTTKRKTVKLNEEIMDRVKDKLGGYYQKKHLKDQERAWEFLKNLEKDSTISTHFKKNSANQMDYKIIQKSIDRCEKQLEKERISSKENWKYYERTYDIEYKQPALKSQKKKHKKENLKEIEERKQLIHQVCTYLQIILENKHKKKWESLEKHKISLEGSPLKALQTRQKINSKGIMGKHPQRHSFNNLSEIMSQISSIHETPACSSGFRSYKNSSHGSPLGSLRRKQSTKQVKSNFTFRKRNIKQGFIKKLDSFLEIVECQEKQFKKERTQELLQINKLESKYISNLAKGYSEQLMNDDKEILAVRDKVQKQK